jgi:hypothetical protein
MCKLMAWTSSTSLPLNKSAADRALCAAAEVITSTQRDGFGFAQPGASALHGRFVEPDDFKGLDALPALRRLSGSGFDAFRAASMSDQVGRYAKTKPLIAHGRTATCGVSLTNTHPFRHKGWSLAHNGVVSWIGESTDEHKAATCDSQHILYCFTDNAEEEQQKAALENITGYAAILVGAPDGRLIVAVDDTATLYGAVTSKGRWVFGTNEAIIEAVGDAWRCKNFTAYKLDAWAWLEFKPRGGDPSVSVWTHKTATARERGYSQRSLGYQLGAQTSSPSYNRAWYPLTNGASKGASPMTQAEFDDDWDGVTNARSEFPGYDPDIKAHSTSALSNI